MLEEYMLSPQLMTKSVVKNSLPPANGMCITEANNESDTNACSATKHICQESDREKDGVDETLIAHEDTYLTQIKGKKQDAYG
eukprot:14284282-Ditylum_brightwellii.AAC.1